MPIPRQLSAVLRMELWRDDVLRLETLFLYVFFFALGMARPFHPVGPALKVPIVVPLTFSRHDPSAGTPPPIIYDVL